jgi:hypothetical protein
MELTIEYLDKKFDLYNEKYFYGILKKPNFKITNTKIRLGCMEYRGGNKYTISISMFYNRNEFWYDNTLIHEMIHLYIEQLKIIDNGSHGKRFKAECERINKDGWKLSRTTDSSQWEISENAKIRNKSEKSYVIIYKENENTQFIFRVAKGNTQKYVDFLKNKCNVVCKSFESNDEIFQKLPICRKRFRGKRLYGNEVEFQKYLI